MKQTNQKKWIYLLKDPRDDSKKYVGSSNNPEKRLKAHIYNSKTERTKKGNWVRKLLTLNLKPILIILKETNINEYEFWEEFYIKELKNEGCLLLNYDDKGIGTTHGLNKELMLNLIKKQSIKIYQYDLKGVFISEFSSLREAERLTGINHGNISKCCAGIFKHTGGYIFTKDKNHVINEIKYPNAIKKIVIEIDEKGNIINEFNSISEAASKTNSDPSNISRVCNGKLKTTNNKKFKFKNDYDRN